MIDMRRNRMVPDMVFINDYPCKVDWFENPGDAVTICVAGDDLGLLDLRFLVGLSVSCSGSTEARAKQLMEICKSFGAHRVGACHVYEGMQRNFDAAWAEVWTRSKKAGE